MMTIAELRKMAQRSTQYGFFDQGSTVWVNCPQCRARVEVSYSMWQTDSRGKRMSKIAQLRAGVLDHLRHDCASIQ